MNFGFNSNVRVGKKLFHVQTEDRGPSHPYLDTVVYEAGRVVYKRSSTYQDFVKTTKDAILPKLLHELLSQQHKGVIAELEAGTIPADEKASKEVEPAPPIASQGINVRLRNPKSWYSNGTVTLDIELIRGNPGKFVDGADVEALLEHEKNRTSCARGRADESGHAVLKFPMPSKTGDGASLVIRATDGLFYGELRFRLKPKPSKPTPVTSSK